MRTLLVIGRHHQYQVREQRAGRVEFLPVQNQPVALLQQPGLELDRVTGSDFRKGIAQAVAVENPPEVAPLLLFAAGQTQSLNHIKMVLRNLAEAAVGSSNGGDDFGQCHIGDARAAIGLRHGDRPQPALRKTIDLCDRQSPLAVAIRRLTCKVPGERLRNLDRLGVGGDPPGRRAAWRDVGRRPAPTGNGLDMQLAIDAGHGGTLC